MARLNSVLLFSAGLDSYILKELYGFANEECLFVHMGTKENKIEEEYIDQFFPGVQKVDLPLHRFELDNKIIPYRNHMLALIAANYANNIYFAFTAGDTTKDKDFVFKAQMEGILNYFSQDTEKVHISSPLVIRMPFKEKTKVEIVEMYKRQRPRKMAKLIAMTTSCYNGDNCGKCRSCLRKFVALTINNCLPLSHFLEDPTKHLHLFYEESILKKRNKQELKEIELCIKLGQQ